MARIVTAEHAHIVVETHVEVPLLVPVPAHQPGLQAAADHLPDLVDAHLGVALRPALDLLRLPAHVAAGGPNVFVGLHVSTCDS